MGRYERDEDWEEPRRRRDRYGAPEHPFDRPLPHSGLGIASCIVGACALLFGVLFGILTTTIGSIHREGIDADLPDELAVGLVLLFLFCLIASLVGLILGIVGAAIGNRNKLFAGLGIGINTLLFLGLLAVFILGAMTS